MKKIITAIGNENLNKKLREENTFEIMANDIQYREGILEYLEQNRNIDFLILSELLQGEIELKELIQKIKTINFNIQIILFLENKNEELENYLYAKGIYFIFYNNQIKISEIIELIKNEKQDTNMQLKRELDELKELLLKKENSEINEKNIFEKVKDKITNKVKSNMTNEKNNKIDNKIKNEITNKIENKMENKINIKLNNETENIKNKIICVSGTSGVGKSIFSVNLANSFMENKKDNYLDNNKVKKIFKDFKSSHNKILIIDFDILNNSLHTILGIKKYSEKIKNKIRNNDLLKDIQIEELIIKVNSKIDLISGINLLFDSQYKISSIKIKTILQKLKQKYETIIIDTSSECFFDYTKEIMKNSNINIFITEANLLEIKKAKNLLNIYINKWEIPQNNFNILFNKYNQNSIDISILKNIFSGFSILGKLSADPNYNLLINKNNINYLEKNLKKEYLKINKELLKSNKK